MDEKFNRYTQYNRDNNEFSQRENSKPPVTPKKQSIGITSDQLRDEYAEREKIFRERLEERYGTSGNRDNSYQSDKQITKSKKVTEKKQAVQRTSNKKITSTSNNQGTLFNGNKNHKANNKKEQAKKEAARKIAKKRMQEKKAASMYGNMSKEDIKNYPQTAAILKARKIKAKKKRRAKICKRIAILMIIVLIIGIGGNCLVNKLQEGAWLDNNFMIEPTTELDYDKVRSNYLYLYSLDEDRMTAGKNQDKRMYPASLTKMMTSIVAIEEIGNPRNLNYTVKVPKNIADNMAKENASVAGFVGGEEVSYMDLLYGVMLPSGADACLTIANQMFGSEANMVKAMNDKAKELDMNNTHFENTVGLHNSNHYSTAKDMCKLMKYGLQNETFKKIISTEEYTSSVTKEHPKGLLFENTVFKKIKQTKKIEEKYGSLIENDGYYAEKNVFYDPSQKFQKKYIKSDKDQDRFLSENDFYIMGGKTGYTEEAHLCLATYGIVDDKEYILITGQAIGNPSGEPFHMYDALYTYGQIHKSHVEQEEYIDDKLWRRIYHDLFGED